MKIISTILFLILSPLIFFGQKSVDWQEYDFPRHFISVNPLNMLLFQQIGISYEYRANDFGFEITPGYIYPNKQEYSNWFIAGPTNYGSLGYYSGFFVVPQINIYVTKPRNSMHTGLIYLALKGVYKYMKIDSTGRYAWDTHSDDYYWVYRRQLDKVNIVGGFVDFGFKCYLYHVFFDINIGPGILSVNHNMLVTGEAKGPSPIHAVNPPRHETLREMHLTVNFSINIGGAF